LSRNPAAQGRKDATQSEMVEYLIGERHLVADTHAVGGGFPDLVVGCTWGEIVVVECKSPGGRLTPEQRTWHFAWRHLPRCMPKSVVELRAWMDKRRQRWLSMR
jgi:hypothetical protein